MRRFDILNQVVFEDCKFGTRAVIIGPWSEDIHYAIVQKQPQELELNSAKGWPDGDIAFVKHYTWLKSIIIIDYLIKDVSPVHDLVNLINLEVLTYCKTRLDFSLFKSLQSCSLEWRVGAESIFDCVTLNDLFLNHYDGTDSTLLSKLVNLRILCILNSRLKEIAHFGDLQQLRELRLGNMRQLESLNGVQSLKLLNRFEIHTCRHICSIDQLASLYSLEKVFILNGGKIDSLQPLKNLPNLKQVIFYESTNILDGDLSFIFGNPKITSVAFQNRRHYTHTMQDFGTRSH